jgi:hypothetical protein
LLSARDGKRSPGRRAGRREGGGEGRGERWGVPGEEAPGVRRTVVGDLLGGRPEGKEEEEDLEKL